MEAVIGLPDELKVGKTLSSYDNEFSTPNGEGVVKVLGGWLQAEALVPKTIWVTRERVGKASYSYAVYTC